MDVLSTQPETAANGLDDTMGKPFQVFFFEGTSSQGSGLWLTLVAIEVMIQRQLIANAYSDSSIRARCKIWLSGA